MSAATNRENLVKLVCGKCGHPLYVPAGDVLTYGEPYPEMPMGYDVAILNGQPMLCSRHGSGRYFLEAASEQPGAAEMSSPRRPQPLHIRDDGAAFIGDCRVHSGFPAELLLVDGAHPYWQMKRSSDLLLGRLEGLPHRPRLVLAHTPAGQELAVLLTLDDALLIPRPDLL